MKTEMTATVGIYLKRMKHIKDKSPSKSKIYINDCNAIMR